MLCLLIFSCDKPRDKIKPTFGPISEFVYASVNIQPDSLYEVFSAVNGILEKEFVVEGDTVEPGQPLLQIINSNPRLNTKNALLAYDLAKKNLSGNSTILSGIKEEIETARLKLNNDSIYFKRQEKLWQQEIGSKVTYEQKKLEYELSKNQLELLQNKYSRTRNELETQLQQAYNNYKNSLIITEDYTITSKINGMVYALYKKKGESVTTIEPIASLGSASVFVIEMLVDEVDIVKLQKGQQCFVVLDAYENEVFKAVIHKIYPKKDQMNQTFKVEARFTDIPPTLYPGLSGEANILIGQKENTLSIPRDYLIEDSKVSTDDGMIKVQVGMENLEMVEILSGITKDTWIYRPSP
ncbi:hypothetical protein GCM10023164_26350 [Christiangramia aestuarii]